MSTMIERVARALQKADGEKPSPCAGACTYSNDWRDYIDDAVTAIAAMREPTEGMLQALRQSINVNGYQIRGATLAVAAMIDAALPEKPEA